MRPIEIRRDVWHTQAKGSWGLLHIGDTAIFLLTRRGEWPVAWRIEIATWFRWFRVGVFGLHRDGRISWHRGWSTAQREHRDAA